MSFIVALHHFTLEGPAGCEEEARVFFGALLGLEECPLPESLQSHGGVWFSCGPQQIHIRGMHDYRPLRIGHPAFEVTNLAAIRSRFALAHVPIEEAVPELGWERFYCRLWGGRVELRERVQETR